MKFDVGQFVMVKGTQWDGRLACVLEIAEKSTFPYTVSVKPDAEENFNTIITIKEKNLRG